MDQGRRSFADPNFDQREREYKLQISTALRKVFELARDGGDWVAELRSTFLHKHDGHQYNLSNWRQHQWLLDATGETEAALRPVLAGFLQEDVDPIDRFRAFERVAKRHAGKPGSNRGSILILGSVFNFAVEPANLPPVKTTVFQAAEDAVGLPRPEGDASEVYVGHLNFAREAKQRFEAAGLPVRDMLDVQSVIWETAVQKGNALQGFIERVLADYPAARSGEPFGRDNPLWAAFEDATALLKEVEAVEAIETLTVNFSLGQGNWARVPWLAFLDARETSSTQRGVYPVLLFREDGSGAYLVIGQGVTEPKRELGQAQAYEALRAKAEEVRPYCAELPDRGFRLDGSVDLRSGAGLGRDYEVSVAAHKFYERGSVPNDAELSEDVAAVIAAYTGYLEDERASGLESLVGQWRKETGYPTPVDQAQIAARPQVAEWLAPELLDAVAADPNLFESIHFGKFVHNRYYGGPGSMAVVNAQVKASAENQSKVAAALHWLVAGEGSDGARIDDVLSKPEFQVNGFKEGLAVKALAVTRPEKWLPIFFYGGTSGKKEVLELPELGLGPQVELDDLSIGERAERSNDLLRELLDPYIEGDLWGQKEFLFWLRDRRMAETPAIGGGAFAELADELCLPEPWLQEAAHQLAEKRQVIFKGPPGTGKTFVAQTLARHLAGDRSRVRLVQFHASYAYEDFVQGYRPTLTDDGSPAFRLVDGPLIEMADRAAADRGQTYVLVIDELNRGNVAKVFGELYFLLEYRNEAIRLQYGSDSSESDFSLPDNLWFIGTMNTADQSIALLDSALRRRFRFIDFYPTEPPVADLLGRWLERKGYAHELGWLPQALAEANARLGDREVSIGPSYFLDEGTPLTEERVKSLWRHAVMPYLEEHFFGQEERRKEFELAALRAPRASPTGILGEETEIGDASSD